MSAESGKLVNGGTKSTARSRPPRWALLLSFIAGSILQLASVAPGQQTDAAISSQSPMRQHYEAAFKFQNAGNLSEADSEYKLYLAMVLHDIANGHANLGDYARAEPVYEAAIRLAPGNSDLVVDFAAAALDASDWRKAKALTASLLDTLRSNAQEADARAASELARALLEMGEHQAALDEFVIAAKLNPGFDSSAQLATAYLVLGDKSNAFKILGRMPERFGDTAQLHLKLGNLYGKTRFFEEAIEEFRKAIAKDDRIGGVHYSLGASYMMQAGEPGYAKAEAEFRKELAVDPANALVYLPLGRIALSRHRYAEAEADLKHAAAMNPQSAATYLVLGQLYKETGRIHESEAVFRKSISLTLDPSKNGYEVEQAHFWLGRLLMQSGSLAEGRKELDISRNLLYMKEQQVEARLSGNVIAQSPLGKTHEANPEQLAAMIAFEKQAGPLIASSYNNLGVNAANAGEYSLASNYFEHAATWNPALSGVDGNWSRAAFAAKDYAQAVGPLSRLLALHPTYANVRAMLGLSLCMIHDYARSLQVLQPMGASQEADSLLTIAYAGSMALAGDSIQGLAQLKSLENASPDVALVHYLLGEVYAGKQQYGESADELRTALRLDPSNSDTKTMLALTDLSLGQKAESFKLLSELAEAGSQDGDIYLRLAKLQIEGGLAKAAVETLLTAIRLKPMNAAYHAELAEAYQLNGQPEEAEHESRQSQTMQAQSELNRQARSSDSETSNNSGVPSKTQIN